MSVTSTPSKLASLPQAADDPAAVSPLESQATLVLEEMANRIKRGEFVRVEEYFARTPELAADSEVAVRLIYEEICLRREYGNDTPFEEYLLRFPKWRASLKMVWECHHLLESDLARPQFPQPGDSLGDFHLTAELGRGLQGRVFLATQPSLADRSLVLKLTPLSGREHLSLARLQHTHIVPLFFVQEDPARRVLILGMPYFGGATLAQLLNATPGPLLEARSGKNLVKALDLFQAASLVESPIQGRARQFLEQASAVQVLCWIGACLADALQYAHERGLLHLDVKPSNILLTADGMPMLLDFHLAREAIQPEGAPPDWLGGTPAYMSPEQQAALEALQTGQPVSCAIDARSDVFSLGMVLRELGGGRVSSDPESGDLRMGDLSIPIGLKDVLRKCLAPNPNDRYRSAADLATDLRRQMADLPLVGVRNRSMAERWRKWRRRRPQGLTVVGLVATALAALGAAVVLLLAQENHKSQEIRRSIEISQKHIANHQYEDALTTLRHAQQGAAGLFESHDLNQELADLTKAAEQARVADELHRVANLVRFQLGAHAAPPDQMLHLEKLSWSIWEKRAEITERLKTSVEPESQERLQSDLLDLAILWTDLHISLATPAQNSATRREALAVLDQAEALFGPSSVLYHKRQTYCLELGFAEQAAKAQAQAASLLPKTAWEHYSLGRALLQTGHCDEAATHFDQAIATEPKGMWAYFYKGICAYRLGRYQEGAMTFTTCIALGPESAQKYFNRALTFEALKDSELALADYDSALKLDPAFGPAALNRGLLYCRQERYSEALDDYKVALQNGADQATVFYSMALVHQACNDPKAALQDLGNCLKANPQHKEAQKLKERLLKQRPGTPGEKS